MTGYNIDRVFDGIAEALNGGAFHRSSSVPAAGAVTCPPRHVTADTQAPSPSPPHPLAAVQLSRARIRRT